MDVAALLQQALESHRNGDLLSAKKGYQAVLKVDPNQPDTLALLGVLLCNMGNPEEALPSIRKAVELDPKAPLFQIHLGNALIQAHDVVGGIKAFEVAVKLDPQRADTHYNLGNAYRVGTNWDDAEKSYNRAIELDPNHVQARNNLSLVFDHREDLPTAIEVLEKALKIEPTYCEGWLNLCSLTEKNEEYERSLRAGEQAKILEPENPSAWFGIGVAYCRMEKHAEALPFYQKALSLKPEWEEVWDNLGQSFQQVNELSKAEEAFKKCIYYAGQSINNEDTRFVDESEYGNRYWHLALLELLKGDYAHGFAHYRSRFKELEGLKRESWPRPLWQGEDLTGKTILVMEEQGAGDCLMMARYVPELKKRGAKVIFYVSKHLAPLFEGWSQIDALIIRNETIPDFDYYTSIFDMPFVFKTTVATIPANVPYLPVLQPDDATRLDGDGRPKVAIVWAGAPLHKHDHRRSLPLKTVLPLFEEKQVQFYSLTLDKRDGDDEILAQTDVIDLAPRLKNFADTARFMNQMDLIISCDTSTAHMAGGLGKKTWTLIPFSPDWRWMLEREDSPWYPTMKVVRQEVIGDWDGVVSRIKKYLQKSFKK